MSMSGEARIAGVMGWPIAHSLSPHLHGHWLQAYGIDGAYVPFAVPPDRLSEALRALPALGMRGVNLTMPHKEAALEICDDVDPAAQRIGAVNTVTVTDCSLLYGSNTDGFGFMENLLAAGIALPEGAAAVVLGAGGAARAVVAALIDRGAGEVRLVNRTRERAEALAARFPAAAVEDWERRADVLDGADILINATNLGMAGHPPLDLVLDALPLGAAVNDIVYSPLETGLLAATRRRGNSVVDGLGMLLHQARPAFRAWFGVDPEVTGALRQALLQRLGA